MWITVNTNGQQEFVEVDVTYCSTLEDLHNKPPLNQKRFENFVFYVDTAAINESFPLSALSTLDHLLPPNKRGKEFGSRDNMLLFMEKIAGQKEIMPPESEWSPAAKAVGYAAIGAVATIAFMAFFGGGEEEQQQQQQPAAAAPKKVNKPPARQQRVECQICFEVCTKENACECASKHVTCDVCVLQCIEKAREPERSQRCVDVEGNLRCPTDNCKCVFNSFEIAQRGNQQVYLSLQDLKLHHVRAVERAEAVKETSDVEMRKREALANENETNRRVRIVVENIRENILTLKCPVCKAAFFDFDACLAVTCRAPCSAYFCGLCLINCHSNEQAHKHAASCEWNPTKTTTRDVFLDKATWIDAQNKRKKKLVRDILDNNNNNNNNNQLTPAVREAVINELRNDLNDIQYFN